MTVATGIGGWRVHHSVRVVRIVVSGRRVREDGIVNRRRCGRRGHGDVEVVAVVVVVEA